MSDKKIKLAFVIGEDKPGADLAVVNIRRIQALNETTFVMETDPFISWMILADGAGCEEFTKHELLQLIRQLKK